MEYNCEPDKLTQKLFNEMESLEDTKPGPVVRPLLDILRAAPMLDAPRVNSQVYFYLRIKTIYSRINDKWRPDSYAIAYFICPHVRPRRSIIYPNHASRILWVKFLHI